MAVTTYTYSVSLDMPGGVVNPTNLLNELRGSSLPSPVRIGTGEDQNSDHLQVVFPDALSAGDYAILDGGTGLPHATSPAGGLLAAHRAETEPTVQLVRSQPQGIGMELCDRDVLLLTSIVGTGSFVDQKVNLATFIREPWNEVTLQGCYKWDAVTSAYVACADQLDADASAVLSVWDYQAKHQTSDLPIKYDLRGGGISVDMAVLPTEDTQIYAIAAPQIPTNLGGGVRLFDGYMHFSPGGEVSAESPQARTLDPALSPAASVLRVFIYYPAGTKRSHVLRLITYRPSGSF